MSHITLTEEQSQVIEQAQGPVEVRNHRGHIIAQIEPYDEAALIAEAKRRLASDQPRYPAAQVEARLRALAEAIERDGLNREQAMALLKQMQAEGRP
jgi:hypothetical protein